VGAPLVEVMSRYERLVNTCVQIRFYTSDLELPS
jgi:hypothetical protein